MRERLKAVDPYLMGPMLMLMVMGLLSIYSAGRGTPHATKWISQSIWNLAGLVAMVYVGGLSTRRVFQNSAVFYILGLVALVLVLVAGKKMGGAQRWLNLGIITLQPSELMKWVTLLFVSHRLGSRPPEHWTNWELAGVGGLVLFPMLLILKQPDLGMALSFVPILLLMLLIRGVRVRLMALAVALMALLGTVAWNTGLIHDYQKKRVYYWLHPDEDAQKKNYQVNQSRTAIGAGGWFGQGFTSGSQTQLDFLPVKTSDFVFASWAEERGFVGVIFALSLFGILVGRMLDLARSARSAAEMYFAAGCAWLFTMHIFVNVGMVAGLLPNKGIVLPFFSYGGSSTLSYFLALGVILNIHRATKVK